MKKLFIATIVSLSFSTAYAATYDNLPSSNNSNNSGSAKSQIDRNIKNADKMNNIEGNMQKYKNSDTPYDRSEFNKYQKEKSAETFKKK